MSMFSSITFYGRSTFGSGATRTKDAPQIGGRGPHVLPPTGGHGGGDDGSDGRPHRRTGPRERLNRCRMGLLLAVGSIFMLFLVLSVAFILRQAGGRMDATGKLIHDWKPLTIPAILWLNTAVLLVSSVTIEIARRQNFNEAWVMEEWLGLGRPTRAASLPWLVTTILLGIGFLIGQQKAWQQLMSQGTFVSGNPSSTFFFMLTGGHAIHLMVGIIALLWAGVSAFSARPLESRQIATDITAWYWHSMGVLWLCLFGVLSLVK
jgi:cytochrome c oxidase subunit 3